MRSSWSEQDELAYLRRSFAQHSAHSYGRDDAADASPLYAALAGAASHDDELLRLTLGANTLPQRPHLLFAAVRYLLLSDERDAELAQFYPDLTPEPRPREQAYPVFRTFCLEHAAELQRLMSVYGVQNNEVGRCSDLLLAFDEVARRGGGKPLAMIELGASAGLLMLWDQYGYEYIGQGYVGDQGSPVQLACALRGDYMPLLPNTIPAVGWRIGVDLHPLDVRSDEDARWLRALIWPEHADRAQRIERALTLARQQPPDALNILAGDAADLLPSVARQAPADATLCVYHSYALNQAPESVRNRVSAHLVAISHTREVFRVDEEWYHDMPAAELEVIHYRDGVARRRRLAECESHGRWLRWLAPDAQE